LHDLTDGGHTSDPFEVSLRSEPVENDRGVDPLAAVVELEEVAEEDLVGFVGEVLRAEHERDVVAGVRLEKNAAEHAALSGEIDGALAEVGRRACPVAIVAGATPPSIALAVAPVAVAPIATAS
jgi:hypothetical protein